MIGEKAVYELIKVISFNIEDNLDCTKIKDNIFSFLLISLIISLILIVFISNILFGKNLEKLEMKIYLFLISKTDGQIISIDDIMNKFDVSRNFILSIIDKISKREDFEITLQNNLIQIIAVEENRVGLVEIKEIIKSHFENPSYNSERYVSLLRAKEKVEKKLLPNASLRNNLVEIEELKYFLEIIEQYLLEFKFEFLIH